MVIGFDCERVGGTSRRVLHEASELATALHPCSLYLRGVVYTALSKEKDNMKPEIRAALDSALVANCKYAVVYIALPLPSVLCGEQDEKALFAFVLPQQYPFKAPDVWLLTEGVFVPSAPPSRRGPKHITKVQGLGDGWSPALTLSLLAGAVLAELGDVDKWCKYIRPQERTMLDTLLASCIPASLEETLQRLLPWDLRNLGKQWRRHFPKEVADLVQFYLGDPASLLRVSGVMS